MENLKNKCARVYDFAMCTEVAVTLAKKFGRVEYFSPWAAAFPKFATSLDGKDADGIHRIDYFFEGKDDVDLFVFPDTYCKDISMDLREQGYRVWAAFEAEDLENNRWETKKLMQEIGLPVQPVGHKCIQIVGVQKLIDYMKKHDNLVIKINMFRGDCETFKHKTWDITMSQHMGELLHKIGVVESDIPFIVEEKIDGIEPGYDGFVIDGKFPKQAMYGYESDNAGYIGKTCMDYELPKLMQDMNKKLSPYFKEKEARTFYSTEVRIQDKVAYLIDPTVRCPMPAPTAVHLEIWENIAEFIWEGSAGNLIDLKPVAKYGAGAIIKSEWAKDHWTNIEIEPKDRQWVKLRMFTKKDNLYWLIPGLFRVATIVGLGNTPEECIDKIEDIGERVNLSDKDFHIDDLEILLEKDIPDGIKEGINF